ncbi:MAG: hypothetical protein JZU63_12560, partial [Rhodoferax sp.]|nr:hypothetical protein [Rhodoferax sp.]
WVPRLLRRTFLQLGGDLTLARCHAGQHFFLLLKIRELARRCWQTQMQQQAYPSITVICSRTNP